MRHYKLSPNKVHVMHLLVAYQQRRWRCNADQLLTQEGEKGVARGVQGEEKGEKELPRV